MSYSHYPSPKPFPLIPLQSKQIFELASSFNLDKPPDQINMWPFNKVSRPSKEHEPGAEPAAEPVRNSLVKPAIDPLADLVHVYPRLAGHMARYPEMQMFRSFGALNVRNLLYLQNE
jgi:hypothetical protein